LFPVHSVDAERELKPRKPSATQHVTGFPSSNFSSPSGQHQSFTFVSSPRYSQRASPPHSTTPAATPPQATDIVHRIGDSAITESSKRTSDLVGATFVQPSKIDWNGKKRLMFVFADLAVKIEGSFILRYRVFDIFSRPLGQHNLTIQAECYGGQFRVYSTKEFPGLQASTELTKHISRYGVRLNIRETERKRRKKGDVGSASPQNSGKGKRKHDDDDDGGTQESDGD